jgi:ankyrin repeat protein
MDEIINKNNYNEIIEFINKMNNITDNLINGNNILHLLAVKCSNHLPNLLKKFPNYFKFGNQEGNTPIHLLAQYGYNDLLKECIKNEPELGILLNNNNENILFMTYENKPLFEWLLKNAIYDINVMNDDGLTLLIKIIIDKDNKLLKKIVDMKNINLDIPKQSPPINGLIMSNNLEGVKLLLYKGANSNIIDSQTKTPLIYSVLKKNKEMCELLLKYGANVNYVGIDKSFNPLTVSLTKNLPEISNLLLDNKINVNTTDKFLETPVHIAIKLAYNNNINEKLLDRIIHKADLNVANINGITPLHLIIKNKLYDKLKSKLKNKELIFNVKDKYNKTPYDYSETIIKRNQYDSQNTSNKNNIKMIKPEKSLYNYGLFSPDIITNIIFMFVMLNKYKNISIPYQYLNEDKQNYELNMLQMNNAFINKDILLIYDLENIYKQFFYMFVPHILLWKNKDVYYFPKNLQIHSKNVLENKEKRFIIFKLTLVPYTSGTHANIVIYDKIKKRAERFEPFGYNSLLDSDDLDIKLEKYLKKTFGKIEYIGPKKYLHKIKFQIISDDNNPNNKKMGDPFGYCLAWTYWFLELRINNPDKDSNELINEAFDKIIKEYEYTPDFMITFIRNYAKSLDSMKNDILSKMNIDTKDYYNTYTNLDDAHNYIEKINIFFIYNKYFVL